MGKYSGEQSIVVTGAPLVEGAVDLQTAAGSLLSRIGIIPANGDPALQIDTAMSARLGYVLNEIVGDSVDPTDPEAPVTREVTGLLLSGGVKAVQAEFLGASEDWIRARVDHFQMMVEATVTTMGGIDAMRSEIIERLEAPPERTSRRGKAGGSKPRRRDSADEADQQPVQLRPAPPDISGLEGLSQEEITLHLTRKRKELDLRLAHSTSTGATMDADIIAAARALRRFEMAARRLLQPTPDNPEAPEEPAYEGVLSETTRARLDFDPFDIRVQQAIGDPGKFDLSAGNCTSTDPESMHVLGTAQNAVLKVCAGCIVRWECLGSALATGESGVWGSMTERERRAFIRKNGAFISRARVKYAPTQSTDSQVATETLLENSEAQAASFPN